VPRPRVRLFEIDDLRSRSTREVARELEVDGEARDSEEDTDDPVDEGKTDGAGSLQNSAGYIVHKLIVKIVVTKTVDNMLYLSI